MIAMTTNPAEPKAPDCYATTSDPPTRNESLAWPSAYDGQIGTEYDDVPDPNIYLDIYDLLGFAMRIQNAINEYGFVTASDSDSKFRLTHVAVALKGTIVGGREDSFEWVNMTGYAIHIPQTNRVLFHSVPKLGDWRNK